MLLNMRIVSWNVNGIRAVLKRGDLTRVFTLHPDILLLQETKARPEQVPDAAHTVPGYWSYWHAPVLRAGYSGVAIYSKCKPDNVVFGIDVPQYDTEGRVATAFYPDLAVVNCYFPNGGQGPERLAYKLAFYEAFLTYVNRLRDHVPRVVWGGDVNTAHEAIDLARPKENVGNTGFLPIERAWLDEVAAAGWADSFRQLHPHRAHAYSYWDMKTRARDRNVGWRIDYLFLSPALLSSIVRADIHASVVGSDHCPVSVDLEL